MAKEDVNGNIKEGSVLQKLKEQFTNWRNTPGEPAKPSKANPISPKEYDRRKEEYEGFVQSGKQSHAIELDKLDDSVKSLMPKLSQTWGEELRVNSAHRSASTNKKVGGAKKSQHISGKALDIDVNGWSIEKRQKFIETARELGFNGIGVYKNAIHLDTGSRRAWGSSYSDDSIPDWALASLK
jgi:hypothetical protein